MALINFLMILLTIIAAIFIYLEVVTVLVDLASPVVFTAELKSWNPFINPVLKVLMIAFVIAWFAVIKMLDLNLYIKIPIPVLWRLGPLLSKVFSPLFVPAVFGLLELIRLKKKF